MLKKIIAEALNFAGHNTGIVIAIPICIAVLIWMVGCESQVRSITKPDEKVTRAELQIEVDTFFALADIRFTQLDQQDALKQTIFEHAVLWTQAGTINPYGLMLALQGVVGAGAIVDNVTKRRREGKAIRKYVDVTIEKE